MGWTQDAFDNLCAVARMTMDEARQKPGSWINPLSTYDVDGAVLYEHGAWYAREYQHKYGCRDEANALSSLFHVWTKQVGVMRHDVVKINRLADALRGPLGSMARGYSTKNPMAIT